MALLLLTGCASDSTPEDRAKNTDDPIVFGPGILIETPAALPQDLDLSARAQEALERLMQAELFTTDAVGYAGITPDEVIALRRLVLDPAGAEALAYAVEHGSMAGRLFALVGLYRVDRARFDALLPTWRDSHATVDYMIGCCILPDTPVGELVDKGNRAAQLQDGRSLEDWGKQYGNYEVDIAGGGWTSMLLDRGGYGTPHLEYGNECVPTQREPTSGD